MMLNTSSLDPPTVRDGEFVTASGARVTADSQPEDMRESRHLYITHREALSRNLTPCVECFPRYATERQLDSEREDGILTEAGVDGAVFPVWIRADKESGWALDSVHDSYTSLLYRAYAIRNHAGSVGDDFDTRYDRFAGASTRRTKKLLPLILRWRTSPISGQFNRRSCQKSGNTSATNSFQHSSNTNTDPRIQEKHVLHKYTPRGKPAVWVRPRGTAWAVRTKLTMSAKKNWIRSDNQLPTS